MFHQVFADLFGRNGKLVIVETDETVELLIEAIDKRRTMAGGTDVLHIFQFLFPTFGTCGNRGTQVPGQAGTDVTGHGLIGRRTHMAGGTGGGIVVILPGNPFRLVHVQLVFKRPVEDAVLGLFVDFFLGMIRTQVALAAGLGLARLFLAETMPGMAGRAGSL